LKGGKKVEDEKLKKLVRKSYGKIVTNATSCCSPATSCCGSPSTSIADNISKNLGYTDSELESVPDGANLGLGCGNPVAIAGLKEGETVLDLGSGAGFDCFLAANKVGKNGKVIGVEMLNKARQNAIDGGYNNVEFRSGEIEDLPVLDESVDTVISNCVINLVPNKTKAFQETFRVLKPGGKLMISDITLLKPLSKFILDSMEAYVGCVAGAILRDDYIKEIQNAGFENIQILDQQCFPIDVSTLNPTIVDEIKNSGIDKELIEDIGNTVASVKVSATKPQNIELKSNNKLKIDIYVPLEVCACQWDKFVNRVFETITPYIKSIDYDTKSTNSEEAKNLGIRGNTILVNGEKRYSSAFSLKRDLPDLLRSIK
jgi:arsenite methyltransferase